MARFRRAGSPGVNVVHVTKRLHGEGKERAKHWTPYPRKILERHVGVVLGVKRAGRSSVECFRILFCFGEGNSTFVSRRVRHTE
jgi:hypothetical protein